MKSAEQEVERPDDTVGGDLAVAVDLLRRLVRGKSFDPGFGGLQVSVGEPEPGVIECTVDITGDTPADRDAIKAKFKKKDGWTCTNTGDKTATCTNP